MHLTSHNICYIFFKSHASVTLNVRKFNVKHDYALVHAYLMTLKHNNTFYIIKHLNYHSYCLFVICKLALNTFLYYYNLLLHT